MRSPANTLITAVVALLLLAAAAPLLIELSYALLPLVVVLTIAVITVRLVFFHSRRF